MVEGAPGGDRLAARAVECDEPGFEEAVRVEAAADVHDGPAVRGHDRVRRPVRGGTRRERRGVSRSAGHLGEVRPDVIGLDLMLLLRSGAWDFADRYQAATGGESIPIPSLSRLLGIQPQYLQVPVAFSDTLRNRSTLKSWHEQSPSSPGKNPCWRPRNWLKLELT